MTLKIIMLNIFALQDPAASGGIDLDSDVITELAIESPNLAGVKLTYTLILSSSATNLTFL